MLHNTDKTVSAAAGFTLFTFLINAKIDSIIIVYLNAIVILGLFGYSVWRLDGLKILRKSFIIGAIAAMIYLPFDNLFGSLFQIGLITYLKHDILLGITPLHIFLNWICLITITLYFYQRLRHIFSKVYFPILLTSIVAFIGSIILSILGNYAGLWTWDARSFVPPPFIGSLPLLVPVGLFLTFLFSPYFVLNILAGGIRCGITLGIMQFLCFFVFRYFTPG
jgi:hypothetical protein